MQILTLLFGSISKIGTFMFLFALFYFFLKYTVCKVFSLHKHVVLNRIYLDDLISLGISLFIILNFFTIHSSFIGI
jgi:NADH:ubiquinone oxidoreductase subunit H